MPNPDARAAEIMEAIQRSSAADNGSLDAAFLAVAQQFVRFEMRLATLEQIASTPMVVSTDGLSINGEDLGKTPGYIMTAQQNSPRAPKPKKFRTKPAFIEAIQAQEGRLSTIPGVWRDCDAQRWVIRTTVGITAVNPGDWIIIDAIGNRNVCTAEAFAETYEPVEDDSATS